MNESDSRDVGIALRDRQQPRVSHGCLGNCTYGGNWELDSHIDMDKLGTGQEWLKVGQTNLKGFNIMP